MDHSSPKAYLRQLQVTKRLSLPAASGTMCGCAVKADPRRRMRSSSPLPVEEGAMPSMRKLSSSSGLLVLVPSVVGSSSYGGPALQMHKSALGRPLRLTCTFQVQHHRWLKACSSRLGISCVVFLASFTDSASAHPRPHAIS